MNVEAVRQNKLEGEAFFTGYCTKNSQILSKIRCIMVGTRQIGYGNLMNVDSEKMLEPTEAELIVIKWYQ